MAASTSTVSWLSRLRRILWWTCCLSGIMPATLPNVLRVRARATYRSQRRTRNVLSLYQKFIGGTNWNIIKSSDIQNCSYNQTITGSLEWMTLNIRRTNSSTLRILSKCFSLCWQTLRTHKRRKLFLEPNKGEIKSTYLQKQPILL